MVLRRLIFIHFMLLLAACNPLAVKTNIDENFQPGLGSSVPKISINAAGLVDRTFEAGSTPLLVGNTLNLSFINTNGSNNYMTYSCTYDRTADGLVSSSSACNTISGLSFAQDNTNGNFSFTPTTSSIGGYEFNVCGTYTRTGAVGCKIFVVDVASNYSTTGMLGYWDSAYFDLRGGSSGAFAGSWKNLFNAGATASGSVPGGSNSPTWSSSGLTYAGSTGSAQSITFGTVSGGNANSLVEAWTNASQSSFTGNSRIIAGNADTSQGIMIKQSPDGRAQISSGVDSYQDTVLADNPVAYYRFNETAGTSLANLANAANPATLYSTATLGQTIQPLADGGKSIRFSNAGGVNLGTDPSVVSIFDPGKSFSVELWARPNSFPATNGYVFFKGYTSHVSPWYQFEMRQTNTGAGWVVMYNTVTGSYLTVNLPVIFAIGAWTHVLITYDDTTHTLTVHTNGGSGAGGTTNSSNATTGTYMNYNSPLSLGNNTNIGTTPANDYDGYQDELALYATALSSARAAAHYAARTTPFCLSSSLLLNGVWNNIAGLFDNGSSTLKLFVNGQSECNVTSTRNTISTGSLMTGADSSNANSWNGSISELRDYNPASAAAATTVVSTNFAATKDRYNFDSYPSTVSGLQAWFKADSLNLADGASVSSWTDSSSNGYTAVQPTPAQQPTFKTNIVNGKPVLRFNSAANQYLDLSTVLGKPANYTTFAVFQTTSVVTRQWVAGSIDATATGAKAWGATEIGNTSYLNGGYNSNDVNGDWPTTTSNPLVANTFYYVDYVYASGSAMSVPNINGITPTYGMAGIYSSTNSGTVYPFSIGRAGAYNAAWYLNGDIAEIIIYNRAVTDTERKRIQSYLKSKYGL